MYDDDSDAPSDEAPCNRDLEGQDIVSTEPAIPADETEEALQQNELLRRRIFEYLMGKTTVPDSDSHSNARYNRSYSIRTETGPLISDDFGAPSPLVVRISSESNHGTSQQTVSDHPHGVRQIAEDSLAGLQTASTDERMIAGSNCGRRAPIDKRKDVDLGSTKLTGDHEILSATGTPGKSHDGRVGHMKSRPNGYRYERTEDQAVKSNSSFGEDEHAVELAQESSEVATQSSEFDEDELERPDFMPKLYAAKDASNLPAVITNDRSNNKVKRMSLGSHFSAQPAPKVDAFQLDNISLPSRQTQAKDDGNGDLDDMSSSSTSSEMVQSKSSSVAYGSSRNLSYSGEEDVEEEGEEGEEEEDEASVARIQKSKRGLHVPQTDIPIVGGASFSDSNVLSAQVGSVNNDEALHENGRQTANVPTNQKKPFLEETKKESVTIAEGSRLSECQRLMFYTDAQHASNCLLPDSPLPTMPSRPMQKLHDAIAHDLPSGDFRPYRSIELPTLQSSVETTICKLDLPPEESKQRSEASDVESHCHEEYTKAPTIPSLDLGGLHDSCPLSTQKDYCGTRPEAFQIQTDEDKNDTKTRRQNLGLFICFTFTILLAISMGLYFGLKSESDTSATAVLNDTSVPSVVPSWFPISVPSASPTIFPGNPSASPTDTLGNFCEDAVAVQAGGTLYSGTFLNASAGTDSNSSASARYELWYSFSGTNLYTTLRYCADSSTALSPPSILSGDCQPSLRDISLTQEVIISSLENRCFDVSFRSQSSVEYKVLFQSESANDSFYFYLMDNRFCDFASPLHSPSITQRNYQVNATGTAVSLCSSSTLTARGSWYILKGIGSNVTLSTCDSVLASTEISVFQGDCNNLQCVASGSGNCVNPQNSQVTFSSGTDETYRILVSADFEGIIGAVVVDYLESVSTNVSISQRGCSDATAVVLGQQVNDSVNATPFIVDIDNPIACPDDLAIPVPVQGSGKWYEFIGSGSRVNLTISCDKPIQPLRVSVYRARRTTGQKCLNYRCETARRYACNNVLSWSTRSGRSYYIVFHLSTQEDMTVPFSFSINSAV